MNEIPVTSEVPLENISDKNLLEQVLINQETILKNQAVLLKAERNRRIWGIVKIVIILLLILVPLLLLPIMLGSMMGGLGGGMNLDAILGNPDALEQLLMQ